MFTEPSRPYPEEEPTPQKQPRFPRSGPLVTYATDYDGVEIALVTVHGSPEPAKLYARDYRIMMKAGLSPHWSLTPSSGPQRHRRVHCYSGCALTNSRIGAARIARVIAQADVTERVCHRDKNPLNLRLDNLRIK